MFLSNTSSAPADTPRRPARDLIAAVLENMRRNLEPLKYSTLAPSRYLIYLHPAEYARLESIMPILQEQTMRALAEELDSLNRRRRSDAMPPGSLARSSRLSSVLPVTGTSNSFLTLTATSRRAPS